STSDQAAWLPTHREMDRETAMTVRVLVLALMLATGAVAQAAPAPFFRPNRAAERNAEAEALARLRHDLAAHSAQLISLRLSGDYWYASILPRLGEDDRRSYVIPLSKAPDRIAAIEY